MARFAAHRAAITRGTAPMSTIAKPPRPMRMNQKAELVPEARFAASHQCAAATPGLSKLELAILDGLCEHHRRAPY